jgi:outer membrane protein assembly factor BamB
MKALWLLGFTLSWTALSAARVEWTAPLGDCQPVDLALSPSGQTYVTCQQSYGEAVIVNSYDPAGRLAIYRTFPADQGASWLPRDLLWHEGILYLSVIRQTSDATDSLLLALDPLTLDPIWHKDAPHFVGNTLVPLPDAGLWWLGVNDARDADILAMRYSKAGEAEASFRYDSGGDDGLGFDRRSGAYGPEQSLYIGGFSQVFRVAADGTLLWKRDFPTTAIVSAADGTLTATHMRAPLGKTIRLDAKGQELWQFEQGGSALTLATDHSIWLTGTKATDQTVGWDLRVLHLNEKGQLETQDLYQGPFQDRAVDIATDADGHAYVLASSYVKSGWAGTADRYLILKYAANGQRLWSHLYGIIGLPEALQVTPYGDVFALGRDGTILLRD